MISVAVPQNVAIAIVHNIGTVHDWISRTTRVVGGKKDAETEKKVKRSAVAVAS